MKVEPVKRPVIGRRWIGDAIGAYWPEARFVVRMGRRIIGWADTAADAQKWARELASVPRKQTWNTQ